MLIVSYFIIRYIVADGIQWGDRFVSGMDFYWAIIAGLIAGVAVGLLTEYYTSEARKPGTTNCQSE